MNIENIAPLILIWIAWTVIERIRKIAGKKSQPPVPYPYETELPSGMEFKPEYHPVIEEVILKEPLVDTQSAPAEIVPLPAAGLSRSAAQRARLRNAVIWSEILAPPIALRK